MTASVRLFCFPHAGATASVYAAWRKPLEPDIELVPVEPAGRGTRFGTPLYGDMREAVEDLCGQICPKLEDGAPFALFGHSLGAVLACEVAYKLKESGRIPAQLFVSGRLPLHIASQDRRHLLPDGELIGYILRLGGMPKDLQDCRDFWELFLPIIRADFRLAEEYRYGRDIIEPLDCPITVLYGLEDDLAVLDQINGWSAYSARSCDYYGFPGGHFFLHERKEETISVIRRKLERMGAGSRCRLEFA